MAQAAAEPKPEPSTEAPPPRVKHSFVALLAAVVLLIAGVGYLTFGTPDYAELAARASAQMAAKAEAEARAQAGNLPDAEQIDGMVAKLEQHLQGKPEDGEGWMMLGRARLMQGKLEAAVAAYGKAVKLRGDDARLLVDYAEALGMQNGRTLAGEPTALIERALKLDPVHPKALALAGAAAFDAKDFVRAVAYWERLVAASPPEAGYLAQVRDSIAQARSQGKLPAADPSFTAAATAPATATATSTATATAAPAAGASISGSVSLSPALAAQASADDTLFVFARAAQGPRMPLVILKKQVRDLPLVFTLDDSMAMSPAMNLSRAQQVVVVARISKSGQAMPQPGDLVAESAAVAVGTAGLKLVIEQTVK